MGYFEKYIGTEFEQNILPAAPPGTQLSANSKLKPEMLGKIPSVRYANGTAGGMVAWQEHETTQEDLHLWDSWKYNVCLRMGTEYIAVDVDSDIDSFNTIVRNAMEVNFGPAPVRTRTNSERFVSFFRLAADISLAKRALKFFNEALDEEVGIDLQMDRSHVVLHGKHPSGGEYQTDLYSRGNELITVDELMLDQFINDVIKSASHLGWMLVSGSSASQSNNIEYMPTMYEESDWINVNQLRFMSTNMRQMIRDGVKIGSRSNAIASVVYHLISYGFDDNHIANILLNPEHGIGEKCQEKGIDWTMKDISRLRGKFHSKDNASSSGSSSIGDYDTYSEDSLIERIDRLDENSPLMDIENVLSDISRAANPALTGKLLSRIKKNTKINIGDLKATLNSFTETDEADTHHKLAIRYQQHVIKNGIKQVAFADDVYQLGDKNIWHTKPKNQLGIEMCNLLDGSPCYTRKSDYNSVRNHYCDLVEDPDFLIDRPHGVATPDGVFYHVDGDQLIVEPIKQEHHVTWTLSAPPCVGPATEWKRFLDQTFEGKDKDEQITMLRQIICLAILGLLSWNQYVILFYGRGATGKSVLLEVLSAIFPRDQRCSVPPYQWDNEYYLAEMSDKMINNVGELSEEKPINGDIFKQTVDRLEITGRYPAGRPFKFIPRLSHFFSANSFPYMKDKSDAFLRRFLILELRNVVPENKRDSNFATKLIKNELGEIIQWALEIAVNVFSSDFIKPSSTSIKLRNEWKSRSNNVLEFLNDADVISPNGNYATPSTTVYAIYKAWCKQSGYKPYGKQNFFSLLRDLACFERKRNKHHTSGGECLIGYKLLPAAFLNLPVYENGLKDSFPLTEVA